MFSINTNTLSKKDWFTIPPLASLRKPASLDSTPTTGISSKSSSPPPDEAESNGSEGTSSDHGPLDVWTTKLNEGVAQNLTFSWDMPVRGPATRGAFLSEQPARVFVASRYHVQPRLEFDPTTTRRFISPSDLLLSLRATLLGAASLLFGWDEMRAKFFVRSEKTKEDDPGDTVLILGELSEETTMSLIEPLLRIGALLRRLDGTIAKLQSPSATPTARAFAYSLQSTTGLILTDLTTRLPSTLTMTTLTRLSMIFNDIQYELDALAGLCLCPMDESPPFAELPTTQTKLLDHLLLALDDAFKHSAPYRIPAMLSHLLTVSSQDFNNSLAITIGLAPESFHPTRTLVRGDRILLPSFFPPRLRTVLENAARALDVLQRADPGHPLCQKESWTWEGPDWGWTDKDLHNIDTRTRNHIRIIRRALSVWYDSASRASSAAESSIDSLSEPGETLELSLKDDEAATAPTRAYKPELQAAFSVFDQLPGSHLASSAQGALDSRLISDGPTSLPFSAPTLSLVIEATLLALPLAHSRLVSSALLRVFTNRLALKTHLKVVRGFLLGGDQAFWSRLRGALFEGSGISKVSTAVGRGVRAGVRVRLGIVDPVRDQIADERAEREGRLREWGVGLAVGLSERGGPGTWPPGGAELGLRLRHVIDDALEVGWGAKLSTESDDERSEAMERGQDEVVLKETSWRLGFILRDLEDENAEGRARWLNPNGKSIEALDFLCLDYKPPDPIDVILTPDIRQKMHRIFTFLLRLLRVETVTKMLFNTMFQPVSDFPPIVLLARFKVQSFVSSLVGYITDIAIGTNWNALLAILSEIQRGDEGNDEPAPRRDPKKDRLPSDIFAVHAHLSTTVDRMLEACLLRARQRGVGNALKECMEAVLVLGKLVGDWCHEQSSDAADSLAKQRYFVLNVTKVLQRFDKLHTALITALRALDTKGGTATGSSNISSEDAQLLRRREGENESAYGRMATWLDPTGRCVKPK